MSSLLHRVHREVFDATSDALLIHDPKGRILDVNEQATGMFGYDRETLLGLTLNDLSLGASPYAQCEAGERVRRAVEDGPQIFTWRSRRRGGALFWSEVAIRAYEADGEVRVIASLRDITERKEAEEELRRKNEMLLALNAFSLDVAAVPFTANIFAFITCRLQELTGARAVAISVYDPVSTTLTVKDTTLKAEENRRLTRFLGRRLEGLQMRVSPETYRRITAEVVGDAGTLSETTFGAIPPALGSLVEKAFGVGWFTGLAMLHDGRLIGTVVMAGDAGTRRPQNEELRAFAGVSANALRRWISEQSSSVHEAQARQERGLTERLLDSLPGIFYLYDADLRLRRWNRTLEEATGFSGEELGGLHLGDWFDVPEDRQLVTERAREILESGGSAQLEVPIRLKDGSTVPYLITGVLLDGPEGRGVMGVGIDMSEQARLQDQLRQALKMEAVGRLAGGVAHDFNNLLTVIAGNVELASEGLRSSDPLAHHLKQINRAAESAISLTRQLLAFSRRQIIEPKILSLNALVEDLHTMLGRLIGEDIVLETELAPDLASVKVDPGQFEQVLVNLAVNARDAMPDGGRLTIGTGNLSDPFLPGLDGPSLGRGEWVLLTVTDTGHGMSEEVKKHLFEPFFTTKPKGRGTGLGLATIFGVVEQAGGRIDVDSEVGRGTAFRIYLPGIEAEPEKLAPRGRAPEIQGGSRTVLVVEDEQSVRELALRFLKRLRYRTLSAANGGEALLLVEKYEGTIDLLVTDVVMPGMNGRELAERLALVQPGMKVLYTSGYTEDVIVHHGVVEAELNFIGKPYSLRALGEKIREVLA